MQHLPCPDFQYPGLLSYHHFMSHGWHPKCWKTILGPLNNGLLSILSTAQWAIMMSFIKIMDWLNQTVFRKINTWSDAREPS